MPAASESFADWACDPRRTLEERYGAELLIEQTLGLWKKKHGIKEETNYQAEQLRRKERELNPAHQPAYSREDARHAGEVLPELTRFSMSNFDDRPLRDLSFLRFCPPLNELEVRRTEIRDWTPLAGHDSITQLHVWGDNRARDLRPLAKLVRLKSARLFFGEPWLDLAGWENLAALEELYFNGNILNLQSIPGLPRLRHLEVHHGYGHSICLRSVADLPAMPELRRLFLENTAELSGIERYPQLRNLTVYGYFTDLAPLAELKELTHLVISGGDYPGVAPLAKLPNLRRLTIRHEVPPDLLPMADVPRLHEIVIEISHIVPPELATLNATFSPWSDEFAGPQPRPLSPLRLVMHKKDGLKPKADNRGAPRDWGDDKEMAQSEARWFIRQTNRRLDALLGQGWGKIHEYARNPGQEHVTITRAEDIDRLPEIIQCLRQLVATARHPWEFFFVVDSLAQYERDIDEIYSADDETFDPDREREEWQYRHDQQLEHRKLLERKYRLRLQQEMGAPISDPQSNPADQPAAEETDTGELQTTAEEAEPEYDLGARLYFCSTLTETTLYLYHDDERGLAEMLLGMEARD